MMLVFFVVASESEHVAFSAVHPSFDIIIIIIIIIINIIIIEGYLVKVAVSFVEKKGDGQFGQVPLTVLFSKERPPAMRYCGRWK